MPARVQGRACLRGRIQESPALPSDPLRKLPAQRHHEPPKPHLQTPMKTLISTIKRNRSVNIPTLIFGAPGVGKSAMVHQAAGSDPVIDVRLAMLDPVDLRGLPTVQGGDVKWAKPEFLPSTGKGILFFDEINTAPPSVQNAALQLILDRRCGPHRLGDGWYIVAAGNKAAHRAHVSQLSAPLRNRFAIVEVEVDGVTWTAWAMAHGIHPDVIGFISFQPDMLSTNPSDEHSNFASPRSWERVSTFLNGDACDLAAITSLVGAGPAAQFRAYQEVAQSLPNLDELLDERVSFTEQQDQITVSYALSLALSTRIIRGDRRLPSASRIVRRLSPEIACLFFVRTMLHSDELSKRVLGCKDALDWSREHQELIKKYGKRTG